MPLDPTPVPTGPEFRVGSTTGDFLFVGPSVAAFADGGFVTAWMGRGADGTSDIVAQRFAAGGQAAGGEFRVNATTVGSQWAPSVAVLADGGFVASWSGMGADGSPDAFARRFAADGAPVGEEFRFNALTSGNQYGPKVAALADGGFVASWTGTGVDGTRDVFARRYAADGSAVGEELHTDSGTAGDQYEPSVAGLADGGFVLSWYASGRGVFAQRYTADGASAGEEFRVNVTTPGNASRPDVAALADGGFVVSWDSNTGNRRADVFAQRFAEDGSAAGGEFRVRESTPGMNWQPAVAGLADGGFVVSWVNSGLVGSAGLINRDIVARRYAADGSAVGGEFRVNATGAGEPEAPAVAALADGGFVLLWDGARAGTTDVLARVFSVPGSAANVRVSVDDAATAEGAAGATAAFAVRLDAASDAEQSVRWHVAGAGPHAADAADFAGGALPSGTLVFAPGEISKSITIAVAGDDAVEADERFTVVLSDPSSGLALGVASASATILDDDLPASAPPAHAAKVMRLYDAALDRLPDRGGFEFWVGALQKGEALSSLASGFLASEEFAARFGAASTDDAAFVERLYQNVLGRAGEAEGRAFWGDSLGKGCSRAEVLAAFSESAEHAALTAGLFGDGAGLLIA